MERGAEPHAARPVVAALCGGERPDGMEPIEALADVRYTDADGLADALRGASVLFVWDFRSAALRDAWHATDALRWVHVAGAGVDRVLFPELADSPVVVTNSRGVFDRPMAEYVLAFVLAFAKDLPATLRYQQAGQWRYRESEDIAGKRVVIAGTGSIGREIARMLRAVGMQVHGVGRTARDADPDFGTVSASTDLAEVVSDADYVVAVAPLTEQTRHMIDADVLAAMPSTAYLINVGRGLLVDDEALVAALEKGEIAGAGLDAFVDEPLPSDHPYWRSPRVIVSPHMSGDSVGWTGRIVDLFASNLRHWLAGEPLRNVVDKRSGFAATGTTNRETEERHG
jgi:phosphoglycerate dehydrogenase-like enzyme